MAPTVGFHYQSFLIITFLFPPEPGRIIHKYPRRWDFEESRRLQYVLRRTVDEFCQSRRLQCTVDTTMMMSKIPAPAAWSMLVDWRKCSHLQNGSAPHGKPEAPQASWVRDLSFPSTSSADHPYPRERQRKPAVDSGLQYGGLMIGFDSCKDVRVRVACAPRDDDDGLSSFH